MEDIGSLMEKSLRERDGDDIFDMFQKSCVGICGLGGLGSNIAVALVRAGVGKLVLIDHDRVDVSNLNRQQYFISQIGMFKTDALRENLEGISPLTGIVTYTERITGENAQRLLEGCDVVCEAFDDAECKAMLLDAVCDSSLKCAYVCSSGMAGLNDPDRIRTRRLAEGVYICGDLETGIENSALYSTGAMICASHQAHTVLRILARKI